MNTSANVLRFPDISLRNRAAELAAELSLLSRDIRFHGHLDNADRAAKAAFVAAELAHEITLLNERIIAFRAATKKKSWITKFWKKGNLR